VGSVEALVIVVEPFAAAHVEGFRHLFDAASSPCFCRYWHFGGTKNEWLDRCAHRPEENLAEQTSAVAKNDVSARGLVAIERDTETASDGERLVGWMKLTPREAMSKLTSLPVYRGLPVEEATWTIGCFLVDPRRRHLGVARALLAAAEVHVRGWGGRVIEGHPRRSTEPLHDEEAWQGPEAMFVELGYIPAHDIAPYPLYRKLLFSAGT
jgi:GNAT superfamily N-acetyltransferase